MRKILLALIASAVLTHGAAAREIYALAVCYKIKDPKWQHLNGCRVQDEPRIFDSLEACRSTENLFNSPEVLGKTLGREHAGEVALMCVKKTVPDVPEWEPAR